MIQCPLTIQVIHRHCHHHFFPAFPLAWPTIKHLIEQKKHGTLCSSCMSTEWEDYFSSALQSIYPLKQSFLFFSNSKLLEHEHRRLDLSSNYSISTQLSFLPLVSLEKLANIFLFFKKQSHKITAVDKRVKIIIVKVFLNAVSTQEGPTTTNMLNIIILYLYLSHHR